MEEDILREIVTRLSWAKIKVFRINCPVGGKIRPNVAGLPDLTGWLPKGLLTYGSLIQSGRLVTTSHPVPLWIEVKRPGGARRTAQTQFIAEAKADGCVAFFAESWVDVVQNLRQAGVEITYAVGGKP